MIDFIKDWFEEVKKVRTFPIVVIYIGLIFILTNRLFQLQIIEGNKYSQESQKMLQKKRYIKGTRGNIYDCNGVPLAINEISYSITLEDNGKLKSNEDKNEMIVNLLKILKRNHCSIDVHFEIKRNKKGKFYFTVKDSALDNFKRDVYGLTSAKKMTSEQKAATAEDIFNFLRSKGTNANNFNIDESYSDREALQIMEIRYAMFMNRYVKYMPIVIASNVDEKTRIAVKENSTILPGVEVATDTYRKYTQAKYFAHVIGYTGEVTEDELNTYAKENLGKKYTKKELKKAKKKISNSYMDADQVGKTGIEKEYENYLHGSKGYENLEVNDTGRILNVTSRKKAGTGKDIYLTIDSDLQKACYDMLEKELASIVLSKLHRGKGNGTKGHAADGITISEYDIYFALIDNNIIDITTLNDKTASDAEKNLYQRFVSRRTTVMNKLKSILAVNSTTTANDLSEEYQEYQSTVYKFLADEGIILNDKVDSKDSTYKQYVSKKISLSEFLQYAISNNWIDSAKLDVGTDYYVSTEIYDKMLKYIWKHIKDNKAFSKRIYYYMVSDGSISPNQLCVVLFEQGVLSYNENTVARLNSGSLHAYDFLRDQIRKLNITPAMLALEPCSGSVIVTDPDNGDVKACVSYPGYNTNKYANKIDTKYYYKMYEDKSYPMMYRAVQTKFAPGSTYKPLVAIAALTSGTISPSTRFTCTGTFTEVSNKPRCWNHSGHGSITVAKAIEYSCNVFFYHVGYEMSNKYTNDAKGIATLKKYAEMFGFDSTSGISTAEYAPNISDMYSVPSAIGQGNNAYTPSQIARYVTALVNQKNCYDLTLLDKVKKASGETVLNNKAKVHKSLQDCGISQSTWSTVYTGMYGVVNGASSSVDQYFTSLKKDKGITVAGKTGTAQTNSNHPNNALFISFAPYNNPEYCTTVVIPNGYTSANAAEVGSNVYKYLFAKTKAEKKKVLEEAGTLVTSGRAGRTD